MITYYAPEKTLLRNVYDYHITHKNNGNDELFFSMPTNDPQYPLIKEEGQVEANGNYWLVKKIYDGDISCELDLDCLKEEIMFSYVSGSVKLSELLASLLPDGWTVTGATSSNIRRTIEFDFATPFDVIQRAMTVYSCTYVWDIPHKHLTVSFPDLIQPTGEYITDELNLRKLSYQGDSSDFATRLYPFGKDAMTIEDALVDGQTYGKKYVENYTYSDKVVATYWSDERYTDPTSLYDDAVAKLAVISKPVQSYECDAIDLAKLDPDYSFLAFEMHRKITLLDNQRSLRVIHEIVEYNEYPDEPHRSVVTLSTVAPTINTEITKVESRVYAYTDNYAHEFELTMLQLRNMIQTLDGNYSLIQQTIDTIENTVSSQGVTIQDILDPTGEMWTAITSAQTTATGANNAIQEEVTERKTYIRFIPQEPAIVLGCGDGNEMKLKLVNNIIYFFKGQDDSTDLSLAYASFDTSKVMTENLLAKRSFRLGDDSDTKKLLIKKLKNGDVIIDQI